jgi:hypothetical protein
MKPNFNIPYIIHITISCKCTGTDVAWGGSSLIMGNVLHNVLIPLSKKSRHVLGRSGGFYMCHTEICDAPASLVVQSYSSKDDNQTRVPSIRNPSDGRFPPPRSTRGSVPETVPSRIKLCMAIGDGLSIITPPIRDDNFSNKAPSSYASSRSISEHDVVRCNVTCNNECLLSVYDPSHIRRVCFKYALSCGRCRYFDNDPCNTRSAIAARYAV